MIEIKGLSWDVVKVPIERYKEILRQVMLNRLFGYYKPSGKDINILFAIAIVAVEYEMEDVFAYVMLILIGVDVINSIDLSRKFLDMKASGSMCRLAKQVWLSFRETTHKDVMD